MEIRVLERERWRWVGFNFGGREVLGEKESFFFPRREHSAETERAPKEKRGEGKRNRGYPLNCFGFGLGYGFHGHGGTRTGLSLLENGDSHATHTPTFCPFLLGFQYSPILLILLILVFIFYFSFPISLGI